MSRDDARDDALDEARDETRDDVRDEAADDSSSELDASLTDLDLDDSGLEARLERALSRGDSPKNESTLASTVPLIIQNAFLKNIIKVPKISNLEFGPRFLYFRCFYSSFDYFLSSSLYPKATNFSTFNFLSF